MRVEIEALGNERIPPPFAFERPRAVSHCQPVAALPGRRDRCDLLIDLEGVQLVADARRSSGLVVDRGFSDCLTGCLCVG